ncbi:MAG: class I tRNA ligase family protein, partial [Clostridia bacterium]|nr:class I tRNA ligase family protein [Clostridia bacterium]
DFAWDVFCDWYIELAKTRLNDKESEKNLVAQKVICYVLTGILKLLHPCMPFITEEIYQALPHDCESIMISEFPTESEALRFPEEAEKMERIIDAITAIRARRSDMNVVPSRKAKVYIATKYTDSFNADTAIFFQKLASASEVEIAESFDASVISADDAVQIITDSAMILLPLSDIIDTEKERARLANELAKLTESAERIEKKLANEGFVAKAPAAVVEGERAKLAKLNENIEGVKAALAKLK